MHCTTELHRPDSVWLVKYKVAAFEVFAFYVLEMVQTGIGSPESLSIWSAHWLTNTTSPILGLLSFCQTNFLSEFTIFITDNPSFSSNQLSSTLTLLSLSSPCHFCSLLTQHLLKFPLSLPLSSPDIGSSYIVETGLELTLWSPSGCGLPLLHAIILNYCTRSATLPTQSFYLVLGSLASLLTQKHSRASWPALLGRIPISPYVLN